MTNDPFSLQDGQNQAWSPSRGQNILIGREMYPGWVIMRPDGNPCEAVAEKMLSKTQGDGVMCFWTQNQVKSYIHFLKSKDITDKMKIVHLSWEDFLKMCIKASNRKIVYLVMYTIDVDKVNKAAIKLSILLDKLNIQA